MPRATRSTNDSPADCAGGMAEHRWRLTDRLIANRHLQGVHLPVPDKTHDAPKKVLHRFLGLVQRAESRVCESIDPVVCKPRRSRHASVTPEPSVGTFSPSQRALLQPLAQEYRIPRATVPHVPANNPHELIRANAALRGQATDVAIVTHGVEGMRLRCGQQPHHPLRQQHAGTQGWAVRRRQTRNPRRPGDFEPPAIQMAQRPFLTILAVGTQTRSWIGPRHAHCALHKHGHNLVNANEAGVGDLTRRGDSRVYSKSDARSGDFVAALSHVQPKHSTSHQMPQHQKVTEPKIRDH